MSARKIIEGGINRIHHWCSVGTEKIETRGPTFPVVLLSFPLNGGPKVWDFSRTAEQ